jgi:hypothetical protein
VFTCVHCGFEGAREIFGKCITLAGKITCNDCRRKIYNERRRVKYSNLDADSKRKRAAVDRQYRRDNAVEISNRRSTHRESNKDELNKQCRDSYYRTRETRLTAKKKYYGDNRDKLIEEMKEYQSHNKDKISSQRKEYRDRNKESISNKNRIYRLTRRKNDPKYKMRQLLKSRLWGAMKLYSKHGKTKACAEYGIDFDAIYKKIGARPSEDHELDHIIPITKFDLDNPEHVRLAHLPCNLRWLIKKENTKKSNTIPEIAYYYPPLWEILVEIGIVVQ